MSNTKRDEYGCVIEDIIYQGEERNMIKLNDLIELIGKDEKITVCFMTYNKKFKNGLVHKQNLFSKLNKKEIKELINRLPTLYVTSLKHRNDEYIIDIKKQPWWAQKVDFNGIWKTN